MEYISDSLSLIHMDDDEGRPRRYSPALPDFEVGPERLDAKDLYDDDPDVNAESFQESYARHDDEPVCVVDERGVNRWAAKRNSQSPRASPRASLDERPSDLSSDDELRDYVVSKLKPVGDATAKMNVMIKSVRKRVKTDSEADKKKRELLRKKRLDAKRLREEASGKKVKLAPLIRHQHMRKPRVDDGTNAYHQLQTLDWQLESQWSGVSSLASRKKAPRQFNLTKIRKNYQDTIDADRLDMRIQVELYDNNEINELDRMITENEKRREKLRPTASWLISEIESSWREYQRTNSAAAQDPGVTNAKKAFFANRAVERRGVTTSQVDKPKPPKRRSRAIDVNTPS